MQAEDFTSDSLALVAEEACQVNFLMTILYLGVRGNSAGELSFFQTRCHKVMILALEQLLDMTMTGSVLQNSVDPTDPGHDVDPSGRGPPFSPVAILKPLISVCLDLIQDDENVLSLRGRQQQSLDAGGSDGTGNTMEDDTDEDDGASVRPEVEDLAAASAKVSLFFFVITDGPFKIRFTVFWVPLVGLQWI